MRYSWVFYNFEDDGSMEELEKITEEEAEALDEVVPVLPLTQKVWRGYVG